MPYNFSVDFSNENIKIQRIIVAFSVLLFIIKVVAYFLTNSVAVLTDALESTVNIIAAFIGLYSLKLSSKPADEDHPYGHGKVEFISAGIEGALIAFAGIIIIYEGIDNFIHPHKIKDIDFGILLVLITAIANFILGFYAEKKGEKNNSLPLISAGKHLKSDTYSTLGIVMGLTLVYFTNWLWLDNLMGVVFGTF
ncbi:MAG: cation transporter, partial [Bacteroidia bacterium]|nr:cation transporter [Bacteroidia bacterium]